MPTDPNKQLERIEAEAKRIKNETKRVNEDIKDAIGQPGTGQWVQKLKDEEQDLQRELDKLVGSVETPPPRNK